ncbi:MAG: type II secretion system F family protein [Actinomycetota bacterium]|nr:type II secretion system F family protein [Actinomycetota bacterium]
MRSTLHVPVLVLVIGWLCAPAHVRVVRQWLTAQVSRGRAQSVAEAVPAFCQAVARRVLVGETLLRAVVGAGEGSPLAPETERVAAEHQMGISLARAVNRWADSDGGFEVGLVSAAVTTASTTVGARPELFDHVAVTLRRRQELGAEARVQASQALMSTWVVAALPWAVGLGLALEGGAPAQVLFAQPLGWTCLALAAALETLGVFWMRRMIDSAIR